MGTAMMRTAMIHPVSMRTVPMRTAVRIYISAIFRLPDTGICPKSATSICPWN